MKDFFLKYVWQFPQMLLAWLYYLISKEDITNTFKGKFYTVHVGANKGAVTLGSHIFISKVYQGDYLLLLLAHESGHVKQSLYLGPLYLFVIGIPSILWAATHKKLFPNVNYYTFPTESNANKLGGIVLNKEGKLSWIK